MTTRLIMLVLLVMNCTVISFYVTLVIFVMALPFIIHDAIVYGK